VSGATLEIPQVITPPATHPFEELGVSPAVVEALAMREIDGAFAIQALVLRDAIAGRDVLGRSQTGSGKTLAFAIPIVERLEANGGAPHALILVPTRELASQVAEEFRAIADIKHLQVATVYGGVGLSAQAKRARRSDIVIATPGRLLDLLARKLIRLDRVRICVLDEADRMLDMGFLPDVKRILETLRPQRQTMPRWTGRWAAWRNASRTTRSCMRSPISGPPSTRPRTASSRSRTRERPRRSFVSLRPTAGSR
jgi:superfamily II DNA/RNA helicase